MKVAYGMKQCKYHKAAHRYMDGMLSNQEYNALEAHLAGCDACRTMLEELKRLTAVFERKQRAHPTPAFMERVHRVITAREKAEKKATVSNTVVIMCRRFGAAAACISIALIGMIYFHLSNGTINGEVSRGDVQNVRSMKKTTEYYPFNTLTDSEKTFLHGDASQALKKLYEMPEVVL